MFRSKPPSPKAPPMAARKLRRATRYEAIKGLVCKNLDITSAPQADNTNAPCDSLSLFLGFEAVQAKLGEVKPGAGQLTPCGATWSDDCTN